jgi:uncharacterized protein
MGLKDKLRDDLNTARRARDKHRTMLLTTTLSEMRNKEIDLKHELSDAEAVDVIQKAIKRRREAAETMRAARPELAEKEESEAAALAVYLPPQMSEEDVRRLVREAITGGASSMGAVMSKIAPVIKGVFDGREANRIVKEELGT